jgi:hypothetical protein
MSTPIDPEVTTQLHPADLAEVAVDEVPDERRQPLEADAADAADQRLEVPLLDDEDDDL